jgi:hypothetical protein
MITKITYENILHNKFNIGELVYHPHYGYGTVYKIVQTPKKNCKYLVNWTLADEVETGHKSINSIEFSESDVHILKTWLKTRMTIGEPARNENGAI